MAVLGGVAHGDVGVDAVVVSTADPFALDVAGCDQVGDDALGGRSVMPTLSAMSRNRAFGSR